MEQDLEARAIEAAKGMYWASYEEYGHDRAFADGIAAYQRVMREGRPGQGMLADLVERFSKALLEKLIAAEVKYGHDNAWRFDDWADRLRQNIREHVDKGDPRDVAAYCAFAWHHGWSLAVMREGRPETTLDARLEELEMACAQEINSGHTGRLEKARAAIHDLFQEARNGK